MLTVTDPASRVVIPQDSAEWVKARIGALTASRMKDVLAVSTQKSKEGAPLKKRIDYAMELVAERMTGYAMDHVVTDAMQWGLDHEAAAKEAYTAVTGREIVPSGFMLHPTIELCGASPDGLVEDGLIEVKCPTTTKHVAWMLAGAVPEEHRPQMLLQLAVTGRKWCDFVSYDPRMPPRQRVFIRRFTPKPDKLDWINEEARRFLSEVESLFQRVTTCEIAA
jgi:putative phage-type endonuclease